MTEVRPDGEYTQLDLIHKEEKAFAKFASVLAANDDKVSIPKIYYDITEGDHAAAAVLDEILFWTLPKKTTGKTSLRVRKDGVLWLAVSRNEWWERKRITARQADRGIDKLEELGLVVKEVHRFNGHAQTHLRVKGREFFDLYGKALVKLYEDAEDPDEGTIKDIQDLYEMMGMSKSPFGNLPNGNLRNGEGKSPNGDSKSPNGNTNNNLQPASNQPPIKKQKLPLRGVEAAIAGNREVTEDDLLPETKLPILIQEQLERGFNYNFPRFGENHGFDRVLKLMAKDGRDVVAFIKWAKAQKRDPHWYHLRPDSLWGDFPQAFAAELVAPAPKPYVEPREAEYVPR